MARTSNKNTSNKRSPQSKAVGVKKSAAKQQPANKTATVKTSTAKTSVAKDKLTSTTKPAQQPASPTTKKTDTGQASPSLATGATDKAGSKSAVQNSTPAKHSVAQTTSNKSGNGIAWLALLCGLGGLAAGGYAYYQSVLNQQSNGSKVVSIDSQLKSLTSSQVTVSQALSDIDGRVQQVEQGVEGKLADIDKLVSENATSLQSLQAQQPTTLVDQTKVLEEHAQVLQLRSEESIKQLSAGLGKRVENWQHQELSSVLSSIERHLASTGDTVRAARGLTMLGSELTSLNAVKYAAVNAQLTADVAALEAVQVVDLENTRIQLNKLSDKVTDLPFMQDTLLRADKPKPVIESTVTQAAAASEGEQSAVSRLKSVGKQLFADLGSMVKIQNIDKTPQASLDAQAKFMLNESIRLNLKAAKFALLSKNDSLFQSELGSALSALKPYYDQNSQQVVAWSQGVAALSSMVLAADVPDISGTRKAFEKAVVDGQ